MKLEIMNYENERISIDVGDRENIATIYIRVISGDEVAEVTYKDYSKKIFDSAILLHNYRSMDYNDYEYEIYNFQKEDNAIDNPQWLKRGTAYV